MKVGDTLMLAIRKSIPKAVSLHRSSTKKMMLSVLHQRPALTSSLLLLVIVLVTRRVFLSSSPPVVLADCHSWVMPHSPYGTRFQQHLSKQYESLPNIRFDWHSQQRYDNRFVSNKTAVYIEVREWIPHITPLLLHMMEIVPPDWQFVFVGTEFTVRQATVSRKASRYMDEGRLLVQNLEGSKWVEGWGRRWDDLNIQEMYNRLLTNASFYQEVLGANQGSEYLFVFSSESILCANSELSLDNWLDFDFIGSPQEPRDGKSAKNGALSLRRISKVLKVLNFQRRVNDEENEGQWLASRIEILPGARTAMFEESKVFAVGSTLHESPMGYLLGLDSLESLVWKDKNTRRAIFSWCPETKIILNMGLERERCTD